MGKQTPARPNGPQGGAAKPKVAQPKTSGNAGGKASPGGSHFTGTYVPGIGGSGSHPRPKTPPRA
jgi:hypothetical protein